MTIMQNDQNETKQEVARGTEKIHHGSHIVNFTKVYKKVCLLFRFLRNETIYFDLKE